MVHCEDRQEESVLCLFLASGHLPADFGVSWLTDVITPISVFHVHMAFSLFPNKIIFTGSVNLFRGHNSTHNVF